MKKHKSEPVFTFWVNSKSFKHFYGVKANASFNFDTPSNVPCHSYFLELFCLYDYKYNVKEIGKDKIDKNDINVCLIPAQGLPSTFYQDSQITGAALEAKDTILWCYDNEIKVVLDRSRERSPWDVIDMIKHLDRNGLVDYNYFRILVDHPTKRNVDKRGPKAKLYLKLIIHSDFFFWEMGGFIHNYINSPKIAGLNLSKSFRKNLKNRYTFSALIGEVKKPHRLNLKMQLNSKGLLDKSFWTTVARYETELIEKRFKEYHDKFISDYGQDLFDELTTARRFDPSPRGLNNATDRILPKQFFESRFNIPFESCSKYFFYTEKTYKPIATEQPFIIYGAVGINKFLTTKQFLIFDEIFDYDKIEGDCSVAWPELPPCESEYEGMMLHAKNFAEEIERVVAEPASIWRQRSVIDKCKHNTHSLKKRTTFEKFDRFVKEVFDSW